MSWNQVFRWPSFGHSDRNQLLFEFGSEAAPAGKTTWRTLIDGAPQEPVRRRVTLLRLRDMYPISTQWSDPVTGLVTFRGLPLDELYVAAAWDHTGSFEYLAGGPMPATLEA